MSNVQPEVTIAADHTLVSPMVPLTFADAQARIASWTDLSATRRRDMASALATVAQMLRKTHDEIPCDIPWLNAHLFAAPPAVLGKSPLRFGNVVSLLRAVLRRLGQHPPEIRGDADLPEEWRSLLARIPQDAARSCLRGFARHCAAQGVMPGAVSDAILADHAALDARARLSSAAASTGATVAAAWNRAQRSGVPGWPDRRLTPPRKREAYTRPFTDFPASFQEDVERYRQRLSGTDAAGQRRGRFVLDGAGPARPLRPASVATRLFALRQAAGILLLQGIPIEEIRSLRDLVQPAERVGMVLDWLAERHAARHGLDDTTPVMGGQLAQVGETLRQVALHHVGLDGAAVEPILAWAVQARPPRRNGMSPRAKDKLRRLIEPRPRALLLHLPDRLMAEARAATSPRQAGRLALQAVALEVLLVCPLRQRSLRELRLGRNFQHLDPRSRKPSRLVLHPDNVKNGNAIDWPLPPRSAAMIDEYVRKFRPAIAAPGNPYLLPADEGGGCRSHNGLAQALQGRIAAYCGVQVSLHALRHLAAWRFLRGYPGQYEAVRQILGHRDLATTMGYYALLEAEAAAMRFDGVVLREKSASRAMAAAAWGKLPKPHRRRPAQVAP